MNFENTKVFNFEGAIRGMRNPLESWDRSDSFFGIINTEYDGYQIDDVISAWVKNKISQTTLDSNEEPIEEGSEEYYKLWEQYFNWWYNQNAFEECNEYMSVSCIGPKDMELMQRLIRSGSEHCKFMRQIFVSVDITAPRYWWPEMDQYKIGTTTNSTSTMHKLTSKPITIDCFETGDYEGSAAISDLFADNTITPFQIIKYLEQLRLAYIETKDKRYWKELVRWLPQSWLQTRTTTMSYANLRNIYFQRRNHKLKEWHQFCNWIDTLPYSKELIKMED